MRPKTIVGEIISNIAKLSESLRTSLMVLLNIDVVIKKAVSVHQYSLFVLMLISVNRHFNKPNTIGVLSA